ncbi:MAG TPA: twin-arginine translocase TatA/TatE family subunit [Thermoleophilaceae bacterium]|nr:twin-arginine translocase TatA/TatE family subunit [Thermoleophilaceae bacterium]
MGFGPSPMEIAVIAVIALIVLGPQKLPEAARSLGKGFREMRDSFSGAADPHSEDLDEYPDEDDEFGDEEEDEDNEDYVPDLDSHDETSAADEPADHQNEARSSVPSASSSSTERE